MKLIRSELFDMTSPFRSSASAMNLSELRTAFSALFDRVAQEVFRRGLDLDDVEVERFLLTSTANGGTTRVPVPSLADRSKVVRYLAEVAGTTTATIVEIGAVVIQELPPPVESGETAA